MQSRVGSLSLDPLVVKYDILDSEFWGTGLIVHLFQEMQALCLYPSLRAVRGQRAGKLELAFIDLQVSLEARCVPSPVLSIRAELGRRESVSHLLCFIHGRVRIKGLGGQNKMLETGLPLTLLSSDHQSMCE